MAFADRIARLNPAVVVVQEFHEASGFGADTGDAAWRRLADFHWGPAEYQRFVGLLRSRLPA
ncbi:MAG: hypothetical protein U0871_19445 [Gemmataceae bacterium]